MNKQDLILVSILLFISLFVFCIFKLNEKKDKLIANVYYKDKLELSIDLNTKLKDYEIRGENGPVRIKAGEGKIKVLEEDSPLHICSKQGYISKSYETIVCLPNKVLIKLESVSNIDAIAK